LDLGLLLAVSRRAKRIRDARLAVERRAVLHILGPQRVATGMARWGGDHGLIARKPVALTAPDPALVFQLSRAGLQLIHETP